MAWNWITDRIALGPQPSASDIPAMHRQGITDVLDVRGEPHAGDQPMGDVYAGSEIRYHYVPMWDRGIVAATQAEATQIYKRGVQVIADVIGDEGRVLVHCSAGQYRSPSMVYAYLRCTGLSHDQAWNKIVAARPVVHDQYVRFADAALPSLVCVASTAKQSSLATNLIVSGIVLGGIAYYLSSNK